ncbi:MAG TPA: anti-sigma factor [Thermomicrobiales bacterium]|nr:anti-sigma factor [Thermomicrobiales bacterium]
MGHRLMLQADHAAVAELLPDFVLGKLGDRSERRVRRHLADCPRCRGECDATLELLGALAAVPPPPPAVRDAIVRRAAAESAALGSRRPPLQLLPAAPPAPSTGAPAISAPRPETPFGRPLPRWALVAASAAVLLVGSFVSWNYEFRNQVSQQMRIYALTSDPSAAHPLNDSDLSAPVSGVLYAEPTSPDGYLVANGLPALPPTELYQVWLFTDGGKPISVGSLTVGADGDARAFLRTPAPFDDYFAVALSAEPRIGSDAPTTAMTLGGVLQP